MMSRKPKPTATPNVGGGPHITSMLSLSDILGTSRSSGSVGTSKPPVQVVIPNTGGCLPVKSIEFGTNKHLPWQHNSGIASSLANNGTTISLLDDNDSRSPSPLGTSSPPSSPPSGGLEINTQKTLTPIQPRTIWSQGSRQGSPAKQNMLLFTKRPVGKKTREAREARKALAKPTQKTIEVELRIEGEGKGRFGVCVAQFSVVVGSHRVFAIVGALIAAQIIVHVSSRVLQALKWPLLSRNHNKCSRYAVESAPCSPFLPNLTQQPKGRPPLSVNLNWTSDSEDDMSKHSPLCDCALCKEKKRRVTVTATSPQIELPQTEQSTEGKEKCQYCGVFFAAHIIFHHRKLHFRERFFSCIDCGKNFQTETGLESHKCQVDEIPAPS
nr:unnamed protein product [Timema tahoe]